MGTPTYPYKTTYTCSISAVNGTTCLLPFAFQAQNDYAPDDIYNNGTNRGAGYFYASTKVTVDGKLLTAPGNPGGPYRMS